MMFAHGYGCDQHMWRLVAPAFADTYRLVLFDHVGAGRSDLAAYDRAKYGSLAGLRRRVLEICAELDLTDVVFVGHSVSAMIGVLAAIKEPERFARLVLVGPSPRYIDDGDYVGGFTREDIDGLLEFQDSNYLGWSSSPGAGDHGQPGPAGAGGGADQQLLPHRPRDRQAVRRGDVPLRQPRRSAEGDDAARSSCSAARTRSPRRPSASTSTATCRTASWSSWTRRGTARTSARRTRRSPRSRPSSA